MSDKPAIGLMPWRIHREKRLDDIQQTILRHFQTNQKVPLKWLKERNKLLKELV